MSEKILLNKTIVIEGPEVALLMSLAEHHLSEKKVNTTLTQLDKFAMEIIEACNQEESAPNENDSNATEL